MENAVTKDIRVFPDTLSLARAAAAIVAAAAAEAIAAAGRCSLALSGGTTPRLLFHCLGSEYRDTISWQRVHLFWADERVVPPDHEQSNFGMVNAELLRKIAIPPGNIHRIRGELLPQAAATAYEMDLESYFGKAVLPRFDLILLGVGEDGHTASLFPGSDALAEKQRLTVPALSPVAPHWRITLTLPVLNNAARIVFLVSGPAKAGIISAILGAGADNPYPAGLVNPARGSLAWLLDKEAAAGLTAS